MSASLLAKLLKELEQKSNCQDPFRSRELGCGLKRISYGVELGESRPNSGFVDCLNIMLYDVFLDTLRIPSNIGKNWRLSIYYDDYYSSCWNKFLGKIFGVDHKEFVVIFKIQPNYYRQGVHYALTWYPEAAVEVLDIQKPQLLVWDCSARNKLAPYCISLAPVYANANGHVDGIALTDYVFLEIATNYLDDNFTFQLEIGDGYGDAQKYIRRHFHIDEGEPLSATAGTTLYAFCLDASSNNKDCVKKYLRECVKFLETPIQFEEEPYPRNSFCCKHLQRSLFPANIQTVTSLRTQLFPSNVAFVSLWKLKFGAYF